MVDQRGGNLRHQLQRDGGHRMSHTVPAAILSALAGESVELFYAIELNFSTAPVRLWTGFGNRTIGGQTYAGAGTLLSISGIEEVADLSAKGITLTLSGVDVSLVSLALQEPYQGRSARVLFGVAGVDDFVEVFAGLMDVMTLQEDGTSATIELTVESKLVTLQRPNIRRYTSESQKLRYPTDTFFDYVEQLQDKEIAWGRKIS
jgi:hypothetical protein